MSTTTIEEIEIPNCRFTGTGIKLRIFLNESFVTSDGVPLQASSLQTNRWYKEVSCSLASNTLTIPSFTIDSTTDGIDRVTSRYVAYFFRGTTNLGIYAGFEDGFKVPTTTGVETYTWAELRTYNFTITYPPYDISGFYTKDQVNYLLSQSSGAASDAKFIVQVADPDLTNAQALGSLGAGLLMNTPVTGVLSIATAETDYVTPTGAGTLTNKTLTSPTINAATLSGTLAGTPTFSGNVIFSAAPSFTGVPNFGNASPTDDTAWSSTGSDPILMGGNRSTTSVEPSFTFQRTQTSGGTAGVGVHAYNLGFTSTGLVGDGYALSVLYRYNNNLTSFSPGNYFQHALMSHGVLNPSNVVAGKNVYLYNLLKSETLVTGVTIVGVQPEAINNSGTDYPNRATTVNAGIGVNAAGGGTNQHSIAYMIEATANSLATSFGVGFWPKRNSVREMMIDFAAGGIADVTGTVTLTNGSPNMTGSGSKFTQELVVGDQVTDDGITWYEVLSVTNDTAATLTANYGGSTGSGKSIDKTIIPMRILRPGYICGTDTINTYRIVGMDASNRVRLDNDGRTIFAGSTPTQLTDAAGKILSAALNTVQPANGGTGLTALGTGVATWLGTPSSANLLAAITDETGTGALVFANTPTLVTPLLGTPTSGTLTNCTGYTTANLSGTVAATQGGTGQTSYAVGDLLYASTTTALSKLADVAVGSVLVSGGVGVAPAWSASPTLTTSLTVPSIFGGTAAGSTLTMKGTSGVAADAAYISMNPMVSGAFPGTVFIGAPTTAGITNTIGGFTDCLHLQGADATIAFATIDSYGTGVNSAIVFRSARGTAAAPTATQTSDTIAVFGGRPYYTHDAGGTPQTPNFAAGNRAAITFKAAEVTKSDAQGMFISFETTPTGSTSRALRGQFTSQGSFYVGSGSAALATTATDGFIYVPSCAGTPTGVPTAITGVTPMVYDTSANKIWFYNGSWRGVVVT